METNKMYDYSLWLYNRYVEEVNGHYSSVRYSSYANILEEALIKHFSDNLENHKLKAVKRQTKELLKIIAQHRRNTNKTPLEYRGKDAPRLTQRDRNRKEQQWIEWEKMHDQTLTTRAFTTEVKALRVVAKIVRSFDQFAPLKMRSEVDAYLCGALNNLLKILEIEGYEIKPSINNRQTLIKKQRS